MARGVGVAQWPRAGQRNVSGTLEYAAQSRTAMGGYAEPTGWTEIGPWKVSETTVPVVVSETESTSVYVIEGPYRRDLWDYWRAGGKVIRFTITAHGLTLKVLELDNPEFRNITLKATCARVATA